MVGGYQIIDFDGMLIDGSIKKTENWNRDYSALVSAISNGVPVMLKNFSVKLIASGTSVDFKVSSTFTATSYDETTGKYFLYFPTRTATSIYTASHAIVYFDENGIKI